MRRSSDMLYYTDNADNLEITIYLEGVTNFTAVSTLLEQICN